MKTHLIRSGPSSDSPLQATHEADRLRGEVRTASNSRDGWDEAFATMALQGDDALLDGEELLPTRWDEEEWEWR